MRLYRKFIRPVHCYPGQGYEPKTEFVEKEEKWYPEEEREHLAEKYDYLDEEPCSNLVFEEKYEPYLLKEQEPKAAIITHQNEYCKDGNCPSCGHELDDNMHPKYCGYCGQEVKWDV